MKELTVVVCPSKLHADGFNAELISKNYETVRFDDKRIILESDYSDDFCNMMVKHCAFTNSYQYGKCIMTQEQIDAWNSR